MLNNVYVEIAFEMLKKNVFQKFFFRVFDVKHDVVFRHDAIALARREKKKTKEEKIVDDNRVNLISHFFVLNHFHRYDVVKNDLKNVSNLRSLRDRDFNNFDLIAC